MAEMERFELSNSIIYAVSAATKHIIIAMREKIKSFFSNFLII